VKTVRISLPLRLARWLSDVGMDTEVRGCAEVRELERAIAHAERAAKTRTALRKPKESKRKAKQTETSSIRAAVMTRAGGRCESCQAFSQQPLQLDHFFGRAKVPQAVSNCWALCWYCHRAKTDNHLGAPRWLESFAGHCVRNGFKAELDRAEARMAVVEAKHVGGAL